MNRINPYIQSEKETYDVVLIEYNQYELECYFYKDGREPLLYVWNQKVEKYSVIGDFYRFCWRAEDISKDLIPDVDGVLRGDCVDDLLSSTLYTAYIYPNFTYFYAGKEDPVLEREKAKSDPTLHVDTKDFRAISVEWMKFLEGLESQKS